MGLEDCEQLSCSASHPSLAMLCDLGQVASPLCSILNFSTGVPPS